MATEMSPLSAIAATNANFSKNFYKVLSAENPGNLVASPLSAQLVLALAHAGARGDTAQEMALGLCLPEDQELTHNGFSALVSTLMNCEKVVLEIANRMYVKHGFPMESEFIAVAEKAFNSTPQAVDFLAPDTRTLINNWVEEKTQNKIKDLIPDGIFDDLTRLVLVNAVYFKGPWLNPFNPEFTMPRPFYTDETNSVDVPTMYRKANFGYANLDELDAQLLELPYEGRQLSLVILLPNKRTGLTELEEKLQGEDLSELVKKAHYKEVEVYLPRFKLEISLDLNGPLQKLGMNKMFSNGADFSGICTTEELEVTKVLQKTFIEVSEEGTEAAAATATIMLRCCDDAQVVEVDRPFLFNLVFTNETAVRNVILFSGCLKSPKLE